MSEPILKVEGVQAKYGDFIAVHSATLDVPEGKIVSLIGSNGAGKSTLMDTVAGLHKPSAGKIYFKGEDITGLPAEKIVLRGLSLVPQGSRCFIRMSVEDNLIMGSFPKTARKNVKKNLERVYSLFPVLKEKRNDPSGSLSGGQRQMVAIGRALMTEPDCLLFDELSLGLAPTIIKDIYANVKDINRDGTTILLVEQDTQRAIKTGEICHVMLKGNVVLSGLSKELGDDEIKKAYFGI
ncbi:MAG: ABC transporter ATP-binding protein [Parasporobacterium sp.]|nr:ABC transporter ATP-binding protein [Parasporobacterium sp.]